MRVRPFVSLLALFALLSAPVVADTVLTFKVSSSGMPAMGQEASDSVQTTWLGDGTFRTDQDSRTVIVDVANKKLYMIHHDKKEYNTLDLPIDFKSLVPEEMAPMIEMAASQMKMDVTVEATEESQKIGSYPTKKFTAHVTSAMGMTMEIDMWVSNDVPLDVDAYKRFSTEMMALAPVGTDWMKKINDIEGFPVVRETKMSMMGNEMTQREELLTVEEKSVPDGNYAPPAEYKLTPFDPMAAMGHP